MKRKRKIGIELWVWATKDLAVRGRVYVSFHEPIWDDQRNYWHGPNTTSAPINKVSAMTGMTKDELLATDWPIAVWATAPPVMVYE